jgi:hypothetical protein
MQVIFSPQPTTYSMRIIKHLCSLLSTCLLHHDCRVSERQASSKGNSENLGRRSRIVPQIIRMASTEQPTGETLVTITTDNSAENECGDRPSSTTLSTSKSRSDPSAAKARSPKIVSFHVHDEQHMVKIEER